MAINPIYAITGRKHKIVLLPYNQATQTAPQSGYQDQFDGGQANTTSYPNTVNGQNAAFAAYTDTINGGLAAT